jgi:hypothetical protein
MIAEETTSRIPAALYPSLLDSDWSNLDEAVQQLHLGEKPVWATGMFRVCRGTNRLAQWLARLAQLPAAGEAVAMRLLITPGEHGEEWRRSFAGSPLVSTQWQRPDGLLAERLGPLELQFRLETAGGGLIYRQSGAALHVGPLRIPLPRWLAPWVTAREMPAGEPRRIEVWVELSAPALGRVIAYEGNVTKSERTA